MINPEQNKMDRFLITFTLSQNVKQNVLEYFVNYANHN